MIPVRNGVVAHLEQYGCNVMTDAYVVGGLLILRTSIPREYAPPPPSGPRATVHRIAGWFDERGPGYGTLIANPGDWEGDFQ